MRRYEGDALPSRAAIAVIANDALGNYVVSTPLLQMLRAKHPDARLHYFSGTRAQELWAHTPTIDWGHNLYGSAPRASLEAAQAQLERDGSAGYDLVINMEQSCWAKAFAALLAGDRTAVVGPCLAPDGRGDWAYGDDARGRLAADKEWIAEDLTHRYPFLQSGFIGEIFCRLAYLDGPTPRYSVPREPVEGPIPDVLIAMSASLPEKLWPLSKWQELLGALQDRGLTVGLLGAKRDAQGSFWKGASDEDALVASGWVQDLRGAFTLRQVVGALASARHVVTLDNGILHLAVSTGVPTVGLYRHGIHRLWAPPYDNLRVLTPGEGRAVSEIEVRQVIDAL